MYSSFDYRPDRYSLYIGRLGQVKKYTYFFSISINLI